MKTPSEIPASNDLALEILRNNQESVRALQQLQEQTARIHQTFLEGQIQAQQSFHALITGTQQLAAGTFAPNEARTAVFATTVPVAVPAPVAAAVAAAAAVPDPVPIAASMEVDRSAPSPRPPPVGRRSFSGPTSGPPSRREGAGGRARDDASPLPQ